MNFADNFSDGSTGSKSFDHAADAPAEGNYYWFVKCNDLVGNEANTSKQDIHIF